jgi:O-antigen/teichoic acid export membrane protein
MEKDINKAKSLLRKLIPETTFARGVSVLVGGTASGQILLVIAGPLLTRLYGPEDFGTVAVYGSLVSLIGVISCMRYELAIPISKSDQEAANVALLSLCLVVGTSILTCIFVFFLGESVTAALSTPMLVSYLWLLPLGVLFWGACSVFSYWNIRKKNFTSIATSGVHQTIATLAVQLTAFKLGGIGLVLGQMAGNAASATNLARPALKTSEFRSCSAIGIRATITRYKRFPIYSTWEGFINSVSHQLAPLGFAALFNVSVVGLYALAYRIITIPMSLIGTAIGQVLFSTAAANRDRDQVCVLFENLCGKLAQFCLPPMVLLILVAPDLFEFVFGATWRKAGVFAQWMVPWIYFQFISSPLSPIFAVLEEQKQGLLWQLLLVSLRSIAIALGGIAGSIDQAVIYFSIASAIAYLIQVFWLGRIVGANQYITIKQNCIALWWGGLIALPTLLSVYTEHSGSTLIWLICSIFLLGIRYLFILSQTDI